MIGANDKPFFSIQELIGQKLQRNTQVWASVFVQVKLTI